uniref:Rab-GAP TBC domain-containing protein n=1 Tax=Rhabditophanes sp. KR3021 TaxID=114890 RepID=A0AC35U818_9BILA
MNREWNQGSAAPGSVKPVYGAQYPPLNRQYASQTSNLRGESSNDKNVIKFMKYETSANESWDADLKVDSKLASTSAQKVIQQHINSLGGGQTRDEVLMPNCYPSLKKRDTKAHAMQCLALQKEPLPGMQTISTSESSLYPILNPQAGGTKSELLKNADQNRFDRLCKMFGVDIHGKRVEGMIVPETINIEQLRNDSWMGIPTKLRPHAWRVLSDYLPTHSSNRQVTLDKKRKDYINLVNEYFHTRFDQGLESIFKQIQIDIPRMFPFKDLFKQKLVQEIFEKLLYIWAIRHPACGYVQGINEIFTPFFVVFLTEYISEDVDVFTFDVKSLTKEQIDIVEADTFWCVSSILDTILENYTNEQPGIQLKILKLKHMMSKIDKPLHNHLMNNQVEYLQFVFRWMNNLLMREIPFPCTVRLWDTYLSEKSGFSNFHVYVCAAILRHFSSMILEQKDFQGIMLLLQNLPTDHWSDRNVCELTAHAFSLMCVFDGAKNHFTGSSDTK